MAVQVNCLKCGIPRAHVYDTSGLCLTCKKEMKKPPVPEVITAPDNYEPPCTCHNFQGDHEEDCYWGKEELKKRLGEE